jgi:hypothetical protein
MGQDAARHEAHARSRDDDVTDAPVRPAERRQAVRPRRPVGRPAGDDDVNPGEPGDPGDPGHPGDPGESEFELIGDDDLGATDLGPAAPNFRDPDAGSGRVRK